jgi:hypothetical protein
MNIVIKLCGFSIWWLCWKIQIEKIFSKNNVWMEMGTKILQVK